MLFIEDVFGAKYPDHRITRIDPRVERTDSGSEDTFLDVPDRISAVHEVALIDLGDDIDLIRVSAHEVARFLKESALGSTSSTTRPGKSPRA